MRRATDPSPRPNPESNFCEFRSVRLERQSLSRPCSGVYCLGWLSGRHLGRRPSALPLDLEDLASGGAIYRSRPRTSSQGQEATRPDAHASASQARLRGRNHTHKPWYRRQRNVNVGEDFRPSATGVNSRSDHREHDLGRPPREQHKVTARFHAGTVLN